MFSCRSAASSVIVLSILAGCARMPTTQPLKPELLAPIQPVEVNIGIAQAELYGAFVRSNAGAAGAAACAAVPGFGILLAAACGGAMGAVDASVNAARAKSAEESVRPLKDEIVDLKFDALMRESVQRSLESVPGMRLSGVNVTKTVTPDANEKAFTVSTSGAVMFVNVDYHLSTDFSTLEVATRGLIYPRSEAARTAAKQPKTLQTASNEKVLDARNAVYLVNIAYHAKLPKPGSDIAQNVNAWKANDGRLLRAAVHDAIGRSTILLAEDLQQKHGVSSTTTTKIDVGNGLKADLVSQSIGGRLLRRQDGVLHFEASLAEGAPALALSDRRKTPSLTVPAEAAATSLTPTVTAGGATETSGK